MVDAFREHWQQMGVAASGGRVLVGFSGGADSTCLLYLFNQIGVEIVAAHLDHRQRPEAASDRAHCQAFCDRLQVPFAFGTADVPRMSQELRVSLEEAGRRARYEFFDRVAKETQCFWIATAHTRDDQIETVLFHLIRGTGISGLAGIPERRDRIIRPLRPFSRSQIEEFCADQGLEYVTDSTNFDPSSSRVRIRHEILPKLVEIHPGARAGIYRLSLIAAEEDALLDSAAAQLLEQAEIELNGSLSFLTKSEEVCLNQALLSHAPVPLWRRAIRLAVNYLGASVEFDWLQDLREQLQATEKGSRTCERGQVVLEWDHGRLHLRNLAQFEPYRHPVTNPGETIADTFGWKLVAGALPRAEGDLVGQSLHVRLNSSKIQGNLYFRSVLDGDSMLLVGQSSEKKLLELMRDAQLTVTARRRIPVICDQIGPVWVPGVAAAGRVILEEGSENSLTLRFEPIVGPSDPLV